MRRSCATTAIEVTLQALPRHDPRVLQDGRFRARCRACARGGRGGIAQGIRRAMITRSCGSTLNAKLRSKSPGRTIRCEPLSSLRSATATLTISALATTRSAVVPRVPYSGVSMNAADNARSRSSGMPVDRQFIVAERRAGRASGRSGVRAAASGRA